MRNKYSLAFIKYDVENLSLNLCEKNVEYIVEILNCERVGIARRLSELGFVKGVKLKVVQFSALKKTMLIEIEGCLLSLRATVAEIVKVSRA